MSLITNPLDSLKPLKPREIYPSVKDFDARQVDMVNQPPHYTDGKIEVIDFIEDKELSYHLGNCVKYISRAGKKDPSKKKQDLEKALWYLKRAIDKL
jgi:hypothetical protein